MTRKPGTQRVCSKTRTNLLIQALFLHFAAGLFGQTVNQVTQPLELSPPPTVNIGGNLEAVPLNNAVNESPEGSASRLALADVMASVYSSFPSIEQARLMQGAAAGQRVGAYGAFDTKLKAYTLSEPTGFYRNFRNALGVARRTWWGADVSAGYRIGRGDFQPWYKERETNEGGEFKVGMSLPLLQGRAIDPQRVAVFQANLSLQAISPLVQIQILQIGREAADAYWNWVAAGARLLAQDELLALAKDRQTKFEQGEEAGKFALIDVVFNRQLVAERQSKVLETRQKYQEATFKLSFYLRGENGAPMLAGDDWRPQRFPVIEPLPPLNFVADLNASVSRRPEFALLNIDRQRIQFDRSLASNQMLPDLGLISEASQDTGIPSSSINDKGQFELIVGLKSEFPIQRRKARGKFQETSAKLAQLQQKIRLQRDKVGIELQTAENALRIAEQLIEQAEIALEASIDSLTRYRYAYTRGYADLIYLNFLETKVNETEIKLVDAQRDWFVALALMQAALGLDPLDQAISVSGLPPSDRPGPGNLPDAPTLKIDELEEDWKLHSKQPE